MEGIEEGKWYLDWADDVFSVHHYDPTHDTLMVEYRHIKGESGERIFIPMSRAVFEGGCLPFPTEEDGDMEYRFIDSEGDVLTLYSIDEDNHTALVQWDGNKRKVEISLAMLRDMRRLGPEDGRETRTRETRELREDLEKAERGWKDMRRQKAEAEGRAAQLKGALDLVPVLLSAIKEGDWKRADELAEQMDQVRGVA